MFGEPRSTIWKWRKLSGESSHFFFIKLFWVGFTKVVDQDLYIEELLRRVPGYHKVILR